MIQTLIIILNLIILESLLSVDNAAVLAIMVKDLPGKQKTQALKYGLLGAYVFRGVCLLCASYLVDFWWLKVLGGLFLLYLVYGHFSSKVQTIEEEETPGWGLRIKNFWTKKIGVFWSTIILVEIMDLAFSIDNVLAAVALSNKFWVIMTGVAIGILAMRFVAGWFVKLIELYPTLETSAFLVIGLLGIKLILTGFWPESLPNTHTFDLLFSAGLMLIFFIPILSGKIASWRSYN